MEEKRQFPRHSVVIPALNQAPDLRHVLPLIPWFVHEIILVDGCSTDDAVAVVQQLGPTIQPPIHIIKQTGKGKGHALGIGFAASEGDIIVTLDADGSTDPRERPFFVEALRKRKRFRQRLALYSTALYSLIEQFSISEEIALYNICLHSL